VIRRAGVLLASAVAAVLAAGSSADEGPPRPFAPSGRVRLVVRPEFRDAVGVLEDLRRFAVQGLSASLVGPQVAVAPPVPGKPAPPPVQSRLLLEGEPGVVARAREILRYLDVPRPSVLVSLLAAETRRRCAAESGGHVRFDRDADAGTPDGMFRAVRADFEPDSFLRSTLTGARPFEGTSIVLGDGPYERVLRMLVHERQAEFLSWPTLVVGEGESGSLASVVRLPQVLFERTNDVHVVTTRQEEAGLKLLLRPVSVGTEAAVLDLTLWLRVAEPATGPDSPPGSLTLRQREVTTRVTVRDRESLLLGGLKIRRRLGSKRGTPLLDRIPVIDVLSSSRSRETEETEILLLVRTRILVPGRSSGLFAPPGETRRLDDAR
jgi:type II secretory pathway component GspD/PulD (secretin)